MSKASTGLRRLGNRLSAKLGVSKPSPRLPDSTGLIVHALHKSASMFLHKFFADLCVKTDCPFYSIHNSPAGNQTIPADTRSSFVLCPVRSFDCESFEFPNLRHVNYLLQVRDPRDILVSEYFSLGWLHTSEHWSQEAKERRKQIRSMSIDEFVLDESLHGKQPLLERMQPVLHLTQRDNVAVVKYETLVTEFPVWLETVLQFAGLGDAQHLKQKLVRQYKDEFLPDQSGTGHKRNIAPGDHKEKLTAQTIDVLNQRFAPVLQELDYV